MDFKWKPMADRKPAFEVISAKRQHAIEAAKRAAEEERIRQTRRPASSTEALNGDDDNNRPTDELLNQASLGRKRNKILDIHVLEEILGINSRMEHEPIRTLDISGKGFSNVRMDHLLGFSDIRELNANENHLNVHQFQQLGALETLTIACNAIRQIESLRFDKDFQCLRVLDLSFNRLGNSGLAALSGLPKLEVLDLMSNSITAIPLDSVCINRDKTRIGFQSLLVLSLERNQLKSTEESMKSLGLLPRLRNLNLDGNQLHTFAMFVTRQLPKSPKAEEKELDARMAPKDNSQSRTDQLDPPAASGEAANVEIQQDPAAVDDEVASINTAQREAEYQEFLQSRIPEDPIATRTVFFESLTDLHLADNGIAQQIDLRGLYSFPALCNVWLKGNPIFRTKTCKSRRQAELIIDMRDLHNLIVKDVVIPDFMMPNEKIAVAERYKRLQESRRKGAEFGSNEKIVKYKITEEEDTVYPFSNATRGKTVDEILADRGITVGGSSFKSTVNSEQQSNIDEENSADEDYKQLFRNPTEIEKAVWRMLGISPENNNNEQITEEMKTGGKTFLTSVDKLTEKGPADELIDISMRKRMSLEQLFDLDSDALDMELPSNIQDSVRLLRQALANPSRYWRMIGEFDDVDGQKRRELSDAKKRKPWFLRPEAKGRLSMEDIQLALRRMDDCITRVDDELSNVVGGSLFSPLARQTDAGKALANAQRQYEDVQKRMKRLQEQAEQENGVRLRFAD